MVETVLCYIEKNDEYLMLHRNKEADDMNTGKWLGIGGHIEENESPDEAVIREVLEETGLTLQAYKKAGIVDFVNDDYIERMHLYTADKFAGEMIECDEGELSWIPKNKILSLNIWEGDRVFLEKLSKNEPYFEIRLIYNNDKFIRSEEK